MTRALAKTAGATSVDEAKPPEYHKESLVALRRELEWHFSDANLSGDQVLHDEISKALPAGGWLSCLWMKQVKRLPCDTTPELILEALKGSHIELQMVKSSSDKTIAAEPDGTVDTLQFLLLRRRQPLPPLLRSECRGLGELPLDPVKAVLRDPHGTLNRLKDQWRVQEQLRIRELGDGSTTFYERPRKGTRSKKLLAVGYERVLYGDDGPYIELNQQQVRWESWPHFHNKKGYQNSYYDEYYTDSSHALWFKRWQQWVPQPTAGLVMLYAQTHPVNDRPWAPSAGLRPHAWREHGYADYRPGYYYLTADGNLISTSKGGLPKKGKAKGRNIDEKGDTGSDESSGAESLSDTASSRPEDAKGSPGQGLATNTGWSTCWNYQAGRCERGAFCKWRHH